MSALQKALRSGLSPAKLREMYAIETRTSEEYPGLNLFIYDQKDSPKDHPVVVESRGSILDSSDWSYVARTMKRFFNYGEKAAEGLDWSTARAYEKLDGSLIHMWYWKGSWHVSTKGSVDAATNVRGMVTGTSKPISFRDLFWATFKAQGCELPDDTSKTYVFELCSPLNKVVVHYTTTEVHLLAVIDNQTGEESDPSDYPYPGPRALIVTSPEHVQGMLMSMDGAKHEGFVIRDSQCRRLKMKHPKYVYLHRLSSKTGKGNLLTLTLMGETDEVLAYFPELAQPLEKIQSEIDTVIHGLESAWERLKDIQGQKEFALAVQQEKVAFKNLLFTKRGDMSGESDRNFIEIMWDVSKRQLLKHFGDS